MNFLTLAWQDFRGDLGQVDIRLQLLAQTLLAFFLLLLSLSGASLRNTLQQNLSEMLGADLVLERHRPLSATQRSALAELSAALSETRLVDITLSHAGRHQQVQLKLVDHRYPLQGRLAVGRSRASEHESVGQGPGAGEIWLDTRALTGLGLATGESLRLRGREYRVTRALFHEPDRLMAGHSVAVRAMAALPAGAGGSSFSGDTRYRYLLNADTSQEAAIVAWVERELPDAHLIRKRGGQHPLAGFWQRVENFFGLSALVLFALGGVAMDLIGRRLLRREAYRQAVYQSLGLSPARGLCLYGVKWMLGVALSFLLAGLLALAGQQWVLQLLQSHLAGAFGVDIEVAWHPAVLARTLGLLLLLLLCLQLPTLIGVGRASVLELLRPRQRLPALALRLAWMLVCFGLLVAAYSDNTRLTLLMIGSLLVTLVLIASLTFALLTLAERLTRRRGGLLAFCLFTMRQRLLGKSAQVMGLGLCATLLLFTFMLLRDLGQAMEANTRSMDGNLLIVRATSAQMADIETWSRRTGSALRQLRPYVRAQLVRINGLAPEAFSGQPSESLSRIARPIRLSWSAELPANNRLTAGRWWQTGDEKRRQISVEDEVMTDLGLSLGDTLAFAIGGQQVEFTLVAGHGYRPGAGSITFWFQVPPGAVKSLGAEVLQMGSMELPERAWSQLGELWRRHPGLELLPVKQLSERFDATLALVTRVVSGYSLLLGLMALLLVAACVRGFERDDRRKNGLLLSLGLRRYHCLRLNLYEWLITAAIAGGGAIAGTSLAGQLIYRSQFHLNYRPDPFYLLGTLAVMAAALCLLGLWCCRHSLKVSVGELMAES
ncbi:Predicted ABC-type transport system involved in lysophospholipase L1 biosynthesis, permease component [Microbulbifer donghaiensis]|uniref:Predicted ABC-type transport system involved in lysophospholipase L1 biosynthesis, permease component n=1 Tax=Microbulbifer donghaiensis TaxID=494016 RepID=A0A1M4XZH5_9GAMM|nr:FtsX-like permease family protein [Microbulbifer donghaiensis]SHE98736.1 Predicted ABC-type transport system involved in lysophospholipase L1 biosynthesis, permease component [Microbulbifer donghaiensis]